ncbi:MAG: hypothetical protein LPK85_07895, partial [Gammaproteobacteria bacterium]|nr:hypothetical protein [Gammaproteobacteria bacterium]
MLMIRLKNVLKGMLSIFVKDIERKNPEAVVRAFREAFAGRDDAHLVVKINSALQQGQPPSPRRQKGSAPAAIRCRWRSLGLDQGWSPNQLRPEST